MIGVIDYGMGNLLSVQNALEYIGEDVKICSSPSELEEMERLILPGVGAFKDCIKNLKEKGFVDKLNEEVIDKQKPILGICLGMQVLASCSMEGGNFEGLGWIPGTVVRLQNETSKDKIPNIGWEDITYKKESLLFKGLRTHPDFYFVHSYFLKCENDADIGSYYNFCNQQVTASVQRGNVFGTQFHPEKSSDHGRQLLENFVEWKK